jgi:5-methyltetrahydropteroyltriglutamate--homocysteine methyltransferase
VILSRDRILTTHVGSLPRNPVLTDLLVRREAGEAIDPRALAAEMDKAVADVIVR